MSAFALNSDHDIELGTGSALARVEGADFVVQSIRTRLLFYLAEWWLDLADGTPWFQEIMVKPARIDLIESKIKRRILGTSGVDEITFFAVTYTAALRDITIQFEVLTAFGPSGLVSVSV